MDNQGGMNEGGGEIRRNSRSESQRRNTSNPGRFDNNPQRAREAGRKGGEISGSNPSNRGRFDNNPQRAAEAGRKGGQASGGGNRQARTSESDSIRRDRDNDQLARRSSVQEGRQSQNDIQSRSRDESGDDSRAHTLGRSQNRSIRGDEGGASQGR